MTRDQSYLPRIVVGVSDTSASRAAVRVGAAEAVRLSLPVFLLRVWRDIDRLLSMTSDEVNVFAGDRTSEIAILRAATEQARLIDPDLEVVSEFVPADLYGAMRSRCQDALLLVVGQDFVEDSDDSFGEWCIRNLECPVWVVDPTGLAVARRDNWQSVYAGSGRLSAIDVAR
jgi:hypothetical protein